MGDFQIKAILIANIRVNNKVPMFPKSIGTFICCKRIVYTKSKEVKVSIV